MTRTEGLLAIKSSNVSSLRWTTSLGMSLHSSSLGGGVEGAGLKRNKIIAPFNNSFDDKIKNWYGKSCAKQNYWCVLNNLPNSLNIRPSLGDGGGERRREERRREERRSLRGEEKRGEEKRGALSFLFSPRIPLPKKPDTQGISEMLQASNFKTRPSAKPFLLKLFFIIKQIKLIFTRNVLHLASF